MTELRQDMMQADAGAPLPNGFPGDAARLAGLVRHDPTIRVAFVGLGGWDTHVNQGGATGQLATYLKQLGEGLDVFARSLDQAYGDTVVMVMSEFGRTVHQNGNAGTDHGHGNVIWVMGGPVRGRKVYGKWPGLSKSELYQDRDLAITTDFREVIATVLASHLGVDNARIDRVLPGHPRSNANTNRLIRV